MLRRLCIITAIISSITTTGWATYYYVSTASTSNNGNTGLTEATAWRTLTYAATVADSSDIVYVKAGDYGAENVVFKKSGTAGKPISFQGYKTIPGDTPQILVNTADALVPFNINEMPTFTGASRTTGIGFNCENQKYLVFKNIQIQNYAYGFLTGSTTQDAGNLVLENVNIRSIGDSNSSYSGEGILLGSMGTKFSNNNTITHCLVVNSSAEGIGVNGNHNTLTDCKVYCNENTNNAATDYYIIVCGSYNTITGCYIERAAGLSHSGHGMGVKSNAEQVIDQGLPIPPIAPQYNKFINDTARNMGESFYVRHRTSQNNLFYHCKAVGTHTGVNNSSSGEGNCIATRDGASNNTFDGCIAENCAAGFRFFDTVEDGDTGQNPPGHPGNNNIYINCLIYNCYVGVKYDDYSIQSDAGDNTIAQCTFYKNRYLYYAARHCTKMKYIGNIYYGCLPNAPGGYFKGSTYAGDILPNGTDTYFKQCDFINIEGGMPAGYAGVNGNIGADPVFVSTNPGPLDLHLQSASPCIDKVDVLSYALKDFDEIVRPFGGNSDMGAFELNNGTCLVASESGKEKIGSVSFKYPTLFFKINSASSGSLGIFDIRGKNIVYLPTVTGNKTVAVDIRDFGSGCYFFRVTMNDKIYTEPFVVKN